jgi:DNA-binding transcriptional regulator LsrR (DeoR family)
VRLSEKEVLKAVVRLEKPASQQQIADSLDCGRATVQRAIKRLKDKGILSVIGDTNPAVYQVNCEMLPETLKAEIAHRP